jgi:hypothetical protein
MEEPTLPYPYNEANLSSQNDINISFKKLIIPFLRFSLRVISHFISKLSLTINAPLILKMRDIIFFAGKLHNGPFQGIFRGGQDFFDP